MAEPIFISSGSDEEEVFVGGKRTVMEMYKATLMGQNYCSPVVKVCTPGSQTDSSDSTLPDVVRQKATQESPSEKLNMANNSSNQQHIGSEQESMETNEKADFESVDILPKKESEQREEINSDDSLLVEEFNYRPVNDTADNNKSINANSSEYSIAALIEASHQLEDQFIIPIPQESNAENISFPVEMNPSERGALSSMNYSFITSEGDSVLNISHGSSLSNSAVECSNRSSLGLLGSVVYEDISYEGDHLIHLAREASKKPQETVVEHDLHMSVDENDFKGENTPGHTTTTKSSLFKSCISDISSYYTARNTENLSESQGCVSSFSNYREALDDSAVLEGVDKAIHVEDSVESANETSFEMVVQNRQNSFTGPEDTSECAISTTDVNKSKLTSKLPKYNFSSNLLKPSQLQLKLTSENMKKTYAWAKVLPTNDTASTKIPTTPSSIVKKSPRYQLKTNTAVNKTGEKVLRPPSTKAQETEKTPSKNVAIQKSRIVKSDTKIPSARKNITENETPARNLLCQAAKMGNSETKAVVYKTPAKNLSCQAAKVVKSETKTIENKTPAKNLLCQPAKFAKSESKLLKVSTFPNKKIASVESKCVLPEKGRYKDIISPVRAYITGTPVVIQRQILVPEDHSSGLRETHIPIPSKMPVCSNTPVLTKSSKAVQKLKYGHDQENVDPNNSRTTLPSRIFKPSSAVFMKEPEPPKRHLPKMGETMTKQLLDTPRPKVTYHQGRVNESPKIKGKLLPPGIIVNSPGGHCIQEMAGKDTRISVRVIKPAEDSHK